MPRLLLVPLLLLLAVPALGGPAASAADDGAWGELRSLLFGERAIAESGEVVTLEAPYRAQDAAIVPISIRAAFPQTPERYIRTLTLVIDENPVPVAAVFHLTADSGLASLATRVRINAYSHVRAIAETSDGALHMATAFVKASGGCSAPALKDQDAAVARLGRMKLRPLEQAAADPLAAGLRQLQLLISHPNYSGLQMDPLTRHYLPPHYVEEIAVRYGDAPLLTVEGGISLSEDPAIRFYYRPDGARQMAVTVRDSEAMTFEEAWPVPPDAGS